MWSISHVARTISQTASHLGEGHVLQYCLLLHLASTKRQACISPHRSRLSCKKVGVRVWVSDILSSEPSLEWECGSARLSCIHHIHKLKNEKFSKERRGSPEVKIYAKCDSAYDCVVLQRYMYMTEHLQNSLEHFRFCKVSSCTTHSCHCSASGFRNPALLMQAVSF